LDPATTAIALGSSQEREGKKANNDQADTLNLVLKRTHANTTPPELLKPAAKQTKKLPNLFVTNCVSSRFFATRAQHLISVETRGARNAAKAQYPS
jgi:hypothetical protein